VFLVSRYLVVDVEVVLAEQSNRLRQLPERAPQCKSILTLFFNSVQFQITKTVSSFWTFCLLSLMIFVSLIGAITANGSAEINLHDQMRKVYDCCGDH